MYRAYVIGGELVVLKRAPEVCDPLFTLAEARDLGRPAEIVFLGLLDGAPRFAVALDPAIAEALKTHDEFVVTDLRSIAVRGLVDANHLPPLAEGKALLNWHGRHRYCSNCGSATNVVEAGWRRDCPSCRAQHFPRTDPVAIMLPVRAGLRARPLASFSTRHVVLPCGLVEPGRQCDAVRRRPVKRPASSCGRVAISAPSRGHFPPSLMIGCHAEALSLRS